MNKALIFLLAIVASAITGVSQDISGVWNGEVSVRGNQLSIQFNIEKTENGYSSSMDIPQQGLTGANATSTEFSEGSLTLKFDMFGIRYEGKLKDQNEFIGNLIQSERPAELNLRRGEIVLNRPQEPKEPFSYQSQEISFESKVDKINLKGTLTLPQTKGKYPLVIIISGSGPQNRDGDMFGHKPYYVLADHLSEKGIAVLRFDERGAGESEGNFETSSLMDFMDDVESAVEFLLRDKNLNISSLGLMGHSIGGLIAPKLASENKSIDFVIMLAGPGVHGDELMLSQKAATERLMGFNEMQVAQGQNLMKGVYNEVTKSEMEGQELKKSLHEYLIGLYGALIPLDQRNDLVNQVTTPEVSGLIRTKPYEYLSLLECPVLALNGSKDLQVTASANLSAIEASLENKGHKKNKILKLEGLNHLFQKCDTGSVNEYSIIEQTFSPDALEIISDWVLSVNK